MQKAGTIIMSLFKNFILRHVDNLLCFIFIRDVLVYLWNPSFDNISIHMQKMNDVLVRNFVNMHYQFSAKVMDPNFKRRVAKEVDF